MFRLLRAKCDFCHRLRLPRPQVNLYACKLRLLQYGLVEQAAEVDLIGEEGDEASEAEEDGEIDPETKMERRNKFVKKCIREAQKQNEKEGFYPEGKNAVAMERRRELIKEFMKDISAAKVCASCK